MTTTQPRPALGSEVSIGQVMVPIPGDSRRGHYIVLVDETTRKIMDRVALTATDVLYAPRHVPPSGQKWLYWGANWDENGDHIPGFDTTDIGHYLPYPPADGIPINSLPEPVNQFAVGPKWLDILSRFAHDVMDFNPNSNHLRDAGTHATGHLPPSDAATTLKNKVTYQLGRAVVGVAFHRVSQWMELDAEMLAQYPATVSDGQNWKIWQDGIIPVTEDDVPIPNMGDMMAMICGDAVKEVAGLCVGAWVYLLNERIDGSSYNSNLNSGGEIRLPDPVWDQWRPNRYLHRVTGTRSERSDQWDDIMGWFRDAHDHYLSSVAPAIEHT